mmetsp:Transcript_31162/g.57094  ORF Transcript_31162/g.57094 Transcript_31162/m.57094 type:complete len:579 (+) Transcript_31162:2-1738(+)
MSKGDVGTVLGQCTMPLASKAVNRVSVEFQPSGRRCNVVAASQIKRYRLAGGFAVGDTVVSLINHEAYFSQGDLGKVIGPCTNPSASDAADRVSVEFQTSGCRSNMLAASQIKKQVLAGGFVVGDVVESLIDHEGYMSKGDVGKVLGPSADPSAKGAADRVSVEFQPIGKACNVIATKHVTKRVFAGGFVTGDFVVSLVDHTGFVSKGDVGKVLGPCADPSASKAADRVSVAFQPIGRPCNVIAATQIKKQVLAGGFVSGDLVVSLLDHEGYMSRGDLGTVLGPCADPSASKAADRVSVAFQPSGNRCNVIAATQIERHTLQLASAALSTPATLAHEASEQNHSRYVDVDTGEYQGKLRLPKGYTPPLDCRASLLASASELKIENMLEILEDIDIRMQILIARGDCDCGSSEYNKRYAFYAYTYEATYLESHEQLYAVLNADLRSRSNGRFKLWMPFIFYLTSGLSTIPDTVVTVYKGIGQLPSSWIVDGSCSIHWSGFTSTSTDEEVARGFAGTRGVVLKIKVFNAKDVQPFSWFGSSEQELMLSPNMEFLVTKSIYKDGAFDYLDLQQIPNDKIWS